MVTFVTKPIIEQLVDTKIKNLDLYQKAFTHKSALKEYEQFTESFETLEFIGDSVLGFVITKFLFDRFEERQEGFLTKARTKLVRGETLAGIAKKMELEKYVIMDEKGIRNGWNSNTKILEDVFEALIGAIYMDIGLLHTKEFILRIYQDPKMVDMNSIMVDDNYKDHLMRHCQVNGWALPDYRVPEPLHVGGIFTTCRAPASWQRTPFATSSRQPPWQRKGRVVGCPLPQSCAPICTMRGRSAPPPALSGARPRAHPVLATFSRRWRRRWPSPEWPKVAKHDESRQKSPMPLKKVAKPAAR